MSEVKFREFWISLDRTGKTVVEYETEPAKIVTCLLAKDRPIDDDCIKVVEYAALAAKDVEIERLQKEIKQILTLGVEMQREVNRKLSLQLDDLKSELAEKDSVLEFYSKSYENDGAFYGTLYKDKVVGGDMETINSFAIAGKRAREVIQKYREKE